MIPKNKVWKDIFQISHAPVYMKELDNGSIVGTFAPVENVSQDPYVPFGLSHEKVSERGHADHVTRKNLNVENSPFDEGVFYDRVIPEDHVWKFKFMDKLAGIHYVRQLPNGQFIYLTELDRDTDYPVPVGISKENLLNQEEEYEELLISVSPF